jgi:integrase/recombinase XerD
MSQRVSLSFHDWPPADRAMWAALIQEGGPLDGSGPLVHLRATSRTALVHNYGIWLMWLSRTHPAILAEAPEARITPQRFHDFLQSRPDDAPYTKLLSLSCISRIVQAHAPSLDWAPVQRYCDHVRQTARRTPSNRKQGRILSSQVLLDLAVNHFETAPEDGETPLARATRRRDAALVAFLALMPMRSRAVAGLELGTSLTVTGDDVWILLSGLMTKNGQPWEAPLPTTIRPMFMSYLDETRPALMAKFKVQHAFVWVNDRGRPLPAHYLSQCVSRTTRHLTGIAIPVHFFRDSAATTLARQSPADARLIRPLLGHLNFEVADRHYIQAQGIAAGRDYAGALRALKGET